MAGSHYVKIPRDLNDLKEKVMFGLTKRQLICLGVAVAIALPTYYLIYKSVGSTDAIRIAGFAAAPAVFFGFYIKNGIPLEKTLKFFKEFTQKPKKLTYKSVNIYTAIDEYIEYKRLEKLLKKANKGK